jgi:signal transduction histidine kinase
VRWIETPAAGLSLQRKILNGALGREGMPGEFAFARLPRSAVQPGAQVWERIPFWEILLTVLLAFGITLVAAEGSQGLTGRWIAGVLLALCWVAGLVARHLVVCRTLAHHSQRLVIGAYAVVVAVMYTAAALSAMQSCVALFAIGPQTFWVLPSRRARRLVVLLSLVPAVRFVDNWTNAMLAEFCVTAVLSVTFSLTAGSWMREIIDQSAERANLIDRLRTAQAKVAQLSEERGMLAERERLAREIHDTLTQGFASILMLVQGVARVTDVGTFAHGQLMIAAQTARENLAEARALVAELAPVSLAGPLDEALKRLADRVGADLGIPLRFSVSGASRELPPDCEVALLRAAQEALANVRRHAAARSVQIMLGYEPDVARLTVADDGVGFTTSPRADGFGLRGMRSRAQMVGGSLRVRSAPGQGTTIVFEVPVHDPSAACLDPAQS